MSQVIHSVVVMLQFDKACPQKQAKDILSRVLEGASLETSIYEESVRNGNNAAPIGYTVTSLSRGIIRPVAENTELGG